MWSGEDGGTGVITIRSSRSTRVKEVIRIEDDRVTNLHLSTTGQVCSSEYDNIIFVMILDKVLCGTFNGSIVVIDVRSYRVMQNIVSAHQSAIRGFTFLSDNHIFWSGGRDR